MTRPLLLSGFMATGKTTVAREVARLCSCEHVDLDTEVERTAGRSIEQIFAERGELDFRKLEAEALERVLSSGTSDLVVSLGGGALLDRSRRISALERAVVVTLEASPTSIISRLQYGPPRPLLSSTSKGTERVELLLEQRRDAYAEAHARLNSDLHGPEELARLAIEHWRRNAVAVAAGENSYVVEIGRGLAAERLAPLLADASATLLVTDENVAPLHGDPVRKVLTARGVKTSEVVLTPGEEHKNLRGLECIFEAAFQGSLDRKSCLVGLGGGVVTDMTGFAAATWMRGIRWVGLPTTLLAMVDASVGGKTAVDYREAKNSVGAFWQPSGVLCDVETLATESERAYVGALAEVVKTALIGDPELMTLLETQVDGILKRRLDLMAEIVERCVRVKAAVVTRDERESGLRAVLNLGHTVGHALESAGGYSALSHGEAVSLGLVAALRIGERLGDTPPSLTERTLALLERLKLPRSLRQVDLEAAQRLLVLDKKRAGRSIRFVVAREVGDVFTRDIPLEEVERMTTTIADA